MKKLAIVIIAVGFSLIILGGYQLFKTNHAQQESLAEAQALLRKEPPFDPTTSPTINTANATTFKTKTGETIGIFSIPKLQSELPIVEGTDADELEKGVGHYKSSAFPGQHDQIVLSGHRDTVFRHMGELEIGDILTIQLPYGDFSYEIVRTKIVDADDRTVIHSTAPKEVLTVTTCYPFSYIGNAPERYIITAFPVN